MMAQRVPNIFKGTTMMSKQKPRVEVSRDVLEHIDPSKPVRVYRNLHKDCISVKQGGIVRCHADNVVLKDFVTIVNEKGRENVRRKKRKEVHAYIKGFVVDAREMWKGRLPYHAGEIYYNPYHTDQWIDKDNGRHVVCGEFADVATDFVLADNYLYGPATGD